MVVIRVLADVTNDRQVVVTLPPEVPAGPAELVVVVAGPPPPNSKRPHTDLADWAEANAEDWGGRLNSEDVEGFTGRRS